MPARRALAVALPLAGLFAAGPGCVWYGPHAMTRVWADKNTLDRPALFVERLSHAPAPRERVERFRWQYGVGPGFPFVPPEATYAAVPPPEVTLPSPPVTGPPAAPPPEPVGGAEPLGGTLEAPKPRANLAWLFTPPRA